MQGTQHDVEATGVGYTKSYREHEHSRITQLLCSALHSEAAPHSNKNSLKMPWTNLQFLMYDSFG